MARSRTKSTLHHHGCTGCRRRYVCGVADCQADGRCMVCRTGRVSAGIQAWGPQECCYRNSPLPEMRTKAEREPYKLFGVPWFKCPTCARQHPCQPEQVKMR